MVGAVIGAFLYLRITVSMWLEEPANDDTVNVSWPVGIVIVGSVLATLVVGFFPSFLLDAARLVRFAPL
jgi:NADH:ubiquinone oxidoreductase subunit 2 (subunit N)